MSDLLELADRVEALVTSDRALDAEIAYVICWRWDDWEEGDICIEDRPLEYVVNSTLNSNNSIWKYLPAYTASLDAALTLVPETVVGWRMDMGGKRAVVRLAIGANPETPEAWARTPALALTAASLRAINSIRRTA
ncbi:MAG TPA: hypothetical protein VF638_00900 [Sphingomonas sp.]|jgi:hypothetical protein